jgi:putative transposase
MQHSRFTEQQITFFLDQVARGASVERTCRAAGIPEETYHRWRAIYGGDGGMNPAEIQRLQEIEEENKRLKRLLASLLVVNPTPTGTAPAPPPRSTSLDSVPWAASAAMTRHWQALAAYLPNSDQINVRTRAFLKRAGWSVVRSIRLPEGSDHELSGTLWVRLLKTWRARKLVIVGFSGGLVTGFAMGLTPGPTEDRIQVMPVNRNAGVDSLGALSSTLAEGWGGSQPWGRWMEGERASILFGFDGPVGGDVELLVEARARLAEGQPEQTLIVRFNDAEIGRWQLPPKSAGQMRHRFIVPRDVVNRETTGQLTFELAGRAPWSAVFGLEAVSLRDVKFLHDYRGFVDSCSNGKVMGWAVAEGLAVSVTASVGGNPAVASQSNTERADLAAQGVPTDSGFELTLTEPLTPGSAIDVRFADGSPLSGSPCAP